MSKRLFPDALGSIVEPLLSHPVGASPHLRGDYAGRLPAYRPIGADCHHDTVFVGPIDAVLAST